MKFEWDPEKDRANQRKHGVAFFTAKKVFADEDRIDMPDDFHGKNVERRITIGKVKKVLFVVYTEKGEDTIRLISARKATDTERRMYYGSDGLFGFK